MKSTANTKHAITLSAQGELEELFDRTRWGQCPALNYNYIFLHNFEVHGDSFSYNKVTIKPCFKLLYLDNEEDGEPKAAAFSDLYVYAVDFWQRLKHLDRMTIYFRSITTGDFFELSETTCVMLEANRDWNEAGADGDYSTFCTGYAFRNTVTEDYLNQSRFVTIYNSRITKLHNLGLLK